MPTLTLQDFLDPTAARMDCYYPQGCTAPSAADVYSLGFADGSKRSATRADLGSIDQRLAEAIDNFVGENPPTSVPELIDATLRHWLHRRLEKPRNGPGPRKYFSRIHTITMPTSESIDFFANTYTMRKNSAGLPVASPRGRNNTSTLSAQDLETQYPGSVRRLQLGIAVGMDVQDLVRQITSDGQVEELGLSTLPDLTIS
jgi:hypothetical protein